LHLHHRRIDVISPANLILAVASIGIASSAWADCVAPVGAMRPRLVELYTSEGCSSCPPADEWLRSLPPQAAAALEFHVDYWDALGWRDRFADTRHTARQQQQAVRDGGTGIYTPQVVLDGRGWSGWYRGSAVPAAPVGSAAMHVSVTRGPTLHVRVDTTIDGAAGGAVFRNFVAVTEDGLSTQVRAGENRGVLLRHDHVVRAFAGPLPLSGEVDIKVPEDFDAAHAAVIAFAQRESDGTIAQVLSCKL
jgi:hypothetical protein